MRLGRYLLVEVLHDIVFVFVFVDEEGVHPVAYRYPAGEAFQEVLVN
jgi:hypothetical protein